MKNKDASDIYDLMLKQLKKGLALDEPNPQFIKLALDFVKQYGLEEEIKTEGKSIDDLISNLPYKSRD